MFEEQQTVKAVDLEQVAGCHLIEEEKEEFSEHSGNIQ
jgi:hypothetical protein